jgi:hypothetical protein
VWNYLYSSDSKLQFNSVNPSGWTTPGIITLYDNNNLDDYIRGSPSATWNSSNNEIAITWIAGDGVSLNAVYFMRVNTSGGIIEGPVAITDAAKDRHSPQVFWTGGSNYTIVYVEDNTTEKAYLRTIDSSTGTSIVSSVVQLTPNLHDIRRKTSACWNGSELGLVWMHHAAYKDEILYFNRFTSNGTIISGQPTTGTAFLADFPGDYNSEYSDVNDTINLECNGASTYGLAWSQYGASEYSDYGETESQFCTIENVSGIWKAPSAPTVFTQNNANRNLSPFITWDGGKWGAIWQDYTAKDVFFRY